MGTNPPETPLESSTKLISNLKALFAAVIAAAGVIFFAGVYYKELSIKLKEYMDKIDNTAILVDNLKARLDYFDVKIVPTYFDVSPGQSYRGSIACPTSDKDKHYVAVSAGMFLNEPNEANASFLRWYTWPESATSFGLSMVNAAGSGMGHPNGRFAAYVACMAYK